jgi:flagellar protein FliO/FliZ
MSGIRGQRGMMSGAAWCLAMGCNAALAAEPAVKALPEAPGGYGAALLRMVISLALVCGVAWLALKWGAKRLAAPTGASADRMRVIARLPIEPRRSVVVVRVGQRTLVLGSSEAGLETLAELSPGEADALVGQATSAQVEGDAQS